MDVTCTNDQTLVSTKHDRSILRRVVGSTLPTPCQGGNGLSHAPRNIRAFGCCIVLEKLNGKVVVGWWFVLEHPDKMLDLLANDSTHNNTTCSSLTVRRAPVCCCSTMLTDFFRYETSPLNSSWLSCRGPQNHSTIPHSCCSYLLLLIHIGFDAL